MRYWSDSRGGRGSVLPLYEDLVRRAIAAQENARSLQSSAERIKNLAAALRDAHAGHALLVHCAWCEKLRIGDEWLELQAIGGGQTRIAERLIRESTHGICPDCLEHVRDEIDRERDAMSG